MAEPSPDWHRPIFAVFLLCLAACATDQARALRMIELKVPSAPIRGSTVKLECVYHLEGDTLYSVKWFKDRQEFYRFMARDSPAKKVFRIKGLTVNQAESSESSVVLNNVQHSASGRYTCEVSADAPSFALVTDDADLRVTEVRLTMNQPPIGVLGGGVRLSCAHNLGEAPLYSFKWYKDNTEFYRFVPRNRPPWNGFTVEGVTVDMLQSNYSSLYLTNLNALSAGTYRCEASFEAPLFLTVVDEKMLTVSELLDTTPTLKKDKENYQVGDTVHFKCASRLSKPAPELKLFVNDRFVNGTATVEDLLNGLQSATLWLTLLLGEENLRESPVRIRCQASFGDSYATSSETSISILERVSSTVLTQQQTA